MAVVLVCDGLAAASCAAHDRVVVVRPARPARPSEIRTDFRRPHDHPLYTVELEPHFVVQYGDAPFRTGAGVGLGFRASIPVLDPGPLTNINNNLAIGFGIDWAHFGGCRVDSPGCYGNDFWFPVVLQWNFFLTRWWSVFPEIGVAVHHASWGWRYYGDVDPGPGPGPGPGGPPGPPGRDLVVDDCAPRGGYCRYSNSVTQVSPVSWIGTRFSLSDRFSITLRVGWPSLLAGVSFRL